MIGFGELRKKSVEWQTEISAVERIYALNRLLKGVYERDELAETLALRDATALSKVYFADYPQVEELDLTRTRAIEGEALEGELGEAVKRAAELSGLQFRLHSLQATEARVEFTGPLGRRSAAQPLIVIRIGNKPLRSEPVARQMLYPFSDECVVNVRAVALEELAAERIVLFSGKPRARDVFDLWFILTRGKNDLDRERTRRLAEEMAAEKRVTLRAKLDEAYAPFLERGWGNALKGIKGRPEFGVAMREIEEGLGQLGT